MIRLFNLVPHTNSAITFANAMERAEGKELFEGPQAIEKMQVALNLGVVLLAETHGHNHAERLNLQQMMTIFDGSIEIAVFTSESQALTARISADLARLRAIAVDPIDICYGDGLSFEVRPLEEGCLFSVYKDGMGGTNVSYSEVGVRVNVYGEEEIQDVGNLSISSIYLVPVAKTFAEAKRVCSKLPTTLSPA